MPPPIRRHEVVIVGDGPAGCALAAALHRRGVDVVLLGSDEPWHATYGTWADDLEAIGWLEARTWWRHRLDSIVVDVGDRRVIERPYGVVDNDALRRHLRRGVTHETGRVAGAHAATADRVVTADGTEFVARLVVDAAGWPGWSRRDRLDAAALAAVPRQTAFGVVSPVPLSDHLDEATLMDWRPPGAATQVGPPSFAYALPVDDGWLVEETVLAARPAFAPDDLAARLAARLGVPVGDLRAAATRIECVDIPMGGPMPDRTSPVVGFGAAAGMIHPATGYSLAASLTGADRVADRIAEELAGARVSAAAVWEAVWPRAARRTRLLHDYGLEVLLDLDAAEVRSFFSTFFELDESQWSAYLRIDVEPRRLAGVMARMFRAAPWPLRRRLVSANPLGFARLLRP